MRIHISAGLGSVPIIFNHTQRRGLSPVHEHPFGIEDAPLETQDVFQRVFLEVFARILLWHAREQVLELFGVRWLRERPTPNDGEDFSGSVIMPRPTPRTSEQLNTARHAFTMKQSLSGLADVIVTILCINPHSVSSQIAPSSRACLLHQAVLSGMFAGTIVPNHFENESEGFSLALPNFLRPAWAKNNAFLIAKSNWKKHHMSDRLNQFWIDNARDRTNF